MQVKTLNNVKWGSIVAGDLCIDDGEVIDERVILVIMIDFSPGAVFRNHLVITNHGAKIITRSNHEGVSTVQRAVV